MKKWIAIILVCVAAAWAYQAMQQKTPPPNPPAVHVQEAVNTPVPPAGEKDLAQAAPALKAVINKTVSHMSMDNDIHDALNTMARVANHYSPQDQIEFDLAPDVKGTVSGTYDKKAIKDILTDWCRQCQCDWEVSGPTTIHIKKM